jgi:hypothetical protein
MKNQDQIKLTVGLAYKLFGLVEDRAVEDETLCIPVHYGADKTGYVTRVEQHTIGQEPCFRILKEDWSETASADDNYVIESDVRVDITFFGMLMGHQLGVLKEVA